MTKSFCANKDNVFFFNYTQGITRILIIMEVREGAKNILRGGGTLNRTAFGREYVPPIFGHAYIH